MQFFERSSEPPPQFFRTPIVSNTRYVLLSFFHLNILERSQRRLSNNTLDLKDSTIFDGLDRLFRGKCAFCETQGSTTPYRFRPPASATPEGIDGHLYYTWLANAWENIYSICLRCVPRQPEYFPVAGARTRLPDTQQLRQYVEENLGLWRDYPISEKALLLDPCRNERFYRHFFVSVSGVLEKLSTRATITIEHFGLNRIPLVEERRVKLREYRELLLSDAVLDLSRQGSGSYALFDFDTMEFGGLWHLQCRMIVNHLSKVLKKNVRVSRSQIGLSFRDLVRHAGFERYRDSLKTWIESDDFGRRSTGAASELKPVSQAKKRKPPVRPLVYPSLTTIELNYFKGIEHLKLSMVSPTSESLLTDSPVQPSMLILGENATGKSSILEATALALSEEETFEDLRLVASDLIFNPGQLGAENQVPMDFAHVRLEFDDGAEAKLAIYPSTLNSLAVVPLPPVFAYGAFRQYQKNSKSYEWSQSIYNLFYSDRLLPDPEPWLLRLNDEIDFPTVMRALRVIMAVESEFEVLKKSSDGKRCLIVILQGGVKVETPLSQVSSGYRSVLAMVCDIMRRLMDRTINPHYQSLENAQAVVLIDEVEAHLHPRWKIQIMSALRKALPRVTFIATSHDPLCVRGMHNGEVVVVHRTARGLLDGGTEQLAQVEQLLDLPDISQLTIEQLLASDFFNLASTDQPLMNLKMAKVADLLSASHRGELSDPEDRKVVARFKQDINDVLPVGTTHAQRVVQEAVARFLQERTTASNEKLQALDEAVKREILDLLEGF